MSSLRSRARGLEADAYFYTEVSDVGAFLDDGGALPPPFDPGE